MKNKLIQKLALYFVLTFSSVTLASVKKYHAVNMQDGGLILTEASDNPNQNVNRTYRSRSLELGYFGRGWCSDLETQLVFQGRGVIRLNDCQSSRPLIFKTNSTASSYINLENFNDQILIKLGYYERRIKNQILAKYNFKGQLIELIKNKKISKIIPNSRGLPEKVLIGKDILIFEWHSVLDLVSKITFKEEVRTFHYLGFNLIQFQMGDQKIDYVYDDLDNLISRKTNARAEQLKIEYDKKSDQVLKLQGACVEIYAYKILPQKRSVSTVNKFCRNQGFQSDFIFDYAQNNSRPQKITVTRTLINTNIGRISTNQGGSL